MKQLVPEEIFAVCFLLLIDVTIIIGNLILCLCFFRDRELRTVTNYFIISLATGDFLVGIFGVPFYIALKLGVKELQMEKYYQIWIHFDILSGISSIMNLTMLTVERYIGVIHPFIHRAYLTRRKAILMIATAWLYALFMTVLSKRVIPEMPRKAYPVILVTLAFLIPLAVIIVAYCRIFYTVKKSPSSTQILRNNWKVARMILIVTGIFVLCWAPFIIIIVLVHFCKNCTVTGKTVTFVKLMHYMNSGINPFIYGYLNRHFSAAFKEIAYKIVCCGNKNVALQNTQQTISLESVTQRYSAKDGTPATSRRL